MHRLLCLLVVLATPLLVIGDTPDEVRKELKTLKGKWKTVAMEAGGMAFPKEMVLNFTCDVGADGKSMGKMPEEEWKFTITIDPKKTPRTIEIMHETGNQKGKKQYGIYKLEGDKWTVCASRPGAAEADRPKDFATKDTTNVVFVFERIKEQK
jgi:uncharacterized protein (TIGR03067 family)